MLKVIQVKIQVKIQEQASYRKKNSELPGSIDRKTSSIDRKTSSINRNKYLHNFISTQTLLKRIGFQVKHY